MCNRVCSSCTWHPRPAVSFARRVLWLECDCKGGDEHETSIPISSLEDSRGAPVRDDYPCDVFSPESYQSTFLIDHLGQVRLQKSPRNVPSSTIGSSEVGGEKELSARQSHYAEFSHDAAAEGNCDGSICISSLSCPICISCWGSYGPSCGPSCSRSDFIWGSN